MGAPPVSSFHSTPPEVPMILRDLIDPTTGIPRGELDDQKPGAKFKKRSRRTIWHRHRPLRTGDPNRIIQTNIADKEGGRILIDVSEPQSTSDPQNQHPPCQRTLQGNTSNTPPPSSSGINKTAGLKDKITQLVNELKDFSDTAGPQKVEKTLAREAKAFGHKTISNLTFGKGETFPGSDSNRLSPEPRSPPGDTTNELPCRNPKNYYRRRHNPNMKSTNSFVPPHLRYIGRNPDKGMTVVSEVQAGEASSGIQNMTGPCSQHCTPESGPNKKPTAAERSADRGRHTHKTNAELKPPVFKGRSVGKKPLVRRDKRLNGEGRLQVAKVDEKLSPPTLSKGSPKVDCATPTLVTRRNFEACGEGRNGKRNSHWLKIKDLKPKQRSSHSSQCGSEDDGIDVDGDGSIDGPGPMLYDWEGKWLPAPVEWEGRKGYKERNFYQRMDQWRYDIQNYYPDGGPMVDIYAQLGRFVGDKPLPPLEDRPLKEDFAPVLGDIAPRSWVPVKLEEQHPQEFWKCFTHIPPPPFDGENISEFPWWETYVEAESEFIRNIPVPIAKLDPTDECFQDAADDNGSAGAMAIRDRLRKDEAEQKRKRKDRRRSKKTLARAREEAEISKSKVDNYLAAETRHESPLPDENRPTPERIIERREPDSVFEPSVNIYLRPVQPSDIFQIVDIYNWHRNFGIFSPEDQNVSVAAMQNRIEDIDQAGLPWIIAVEKGGRIRGRGHSAVQEKVIGFTYVDDYHSPTGMWRYTGELEIFVHDDHRQRGVGSCLLDKILQLLDPSYRPRGGYEWRCEEDDAKYLTGGGRELGTIICHLPYVHGDVDYFDRMARWFAKFDIFQRGNIEMGGVKDDKMVDLAIFSCKTGKHIGSL